jgi:hypothetical protein
MGKLVINLKKEIKQEIMAEVGKETTKMRNEYNAKILKHDEIFWLGLILR